MTKAEIQQVKLRFGIIGNNEALMRAIDIAIQCIIMEMEAATTVQLYIIMKNWQTQNYKCC